MGMKLPDSFMRSLQGFSRFRIQWLTGQARLIRGYFKLFGAIQFQRIETLGQGQQCLITLVTHRVDYVPNRLIHRCIEGLGPIQQGLKCRIKAGCASV